MSKYKASITKVAKWCPSDFRGDKRKFGIKNWNEDSQLSDGAPEFGPTVERTFTTDLHHVKIKQGGKNVLDFGLIIRNQNAAGVGEVMDHIVKSYVKLLNSGRGQLRRFNQYSSTGYIPQIKRYEDLKAFQSGTCAEVSIINSSKLSEKVDKPQTYVDEEGEETTTTTLPDWDRDHVEQVFLVVGFDLLLDELAYELGVACSLSLNEKHAHNPAPTPPTNWKGGLRNVADMDPSEPSLSLREQVKFIADNPEFQSRGTPYPETSCTRYTPSSASQVEGFTWRNATKRWIDEDVDFSSMTPDEAEAFVRDEITQLKEKLGEPSIGDKYHYMRYAIQAALQWKPGRQIENMWRTFRELVPAYSNPDCLIDYFEYDNNRHTPQCKAVRRSQRVANSSLGTWFNSEQEPYTPSVTASRVNLVNDDGEFVRLGKIEHSIIGFTGFDDLDEDYQKWVDEGEKLYDGAITAIKNSRLLYG